MKVFCRGLSTMIVQFLILLLRGFIHVKILEWNANKSASRLYVYAPSVLCQLLTCEHQIHIHTSHLLLLLT
jgi:hypothetical protein